jgi:hypothetical protein
MVPEDTIVIETAWWYGKNKINKYKTVLCKEPRSAVTICFVYSVHVKPNWSPSPPHMDGLTSKWRHFAVLSPSLLLHYLHIFGKLGKFCPPPPPLFHCTTLFVYTK